MTTNLLITVGRKGITSAMADAMRHKRAADRVRIPANLRGASPAIGASDDCARMNGLSLTWYFCQRHEPSLAAARAIAAERPRDRTVAVWDAEMLHFDYA